MKIFQEEAGIISENKVWVCVHNGYMYTSDTLEELVEVLNTEWELDKYLVG